MSSELEFVLVGLAEWLPGHRAADRRNDELGVVAMSYHRPSRTTAERRKIYERAMAWKAERAELQAVLDSAHECSACRTGHHDPGYGEDGVCRCRCCDRDMTDEGFPWLPRPAIALPAS